MVLLQLLENPEAGIAFLAVLIIGLTVHEYAHAWSALKLGDPTAYLQGRLTLNPMSHLDPIGALMFLIVGFGWAKPVPIDPYRLGARNTLWVSLAGPASNVLMASAALLPMRFPGLGDPRSQTAAYIAGFLSIFGLFNLILAVFNMIPLAPLDGWKVLLGLVPTDTYWRLREYEQYGPMILLVLILLGNFGGVPIIGRLVFGVADFVYVRLAGVVPPM